MVQKQEDRMKKMHNDRKGFNLADKVLIGPETGI